MKELAAEVEKIRVGGVDLVHQINHHIGRFLLSKHTPRGGRPLEERGRGRDRERKQERERERERERE